jgi:hypothetical protein
MIGARNCATGRPTAFG